LKAGKVRRSIQRFNDYASDLIHSDMNNFDNRLNVLLEFFRTDELLSNIHNQLTDTSSINLNSWYDEVSKTRTGMAGSGKLILPVNLEERISLMYQILNLMQEDKKEPFNFVRPFYTSRSNRFDDYVRFFNENFSEPLLREISYKLEDLDLDLPEDDRQEIQNIPMVQIIHNAQNVVQQSVNGNNNSQSASINVNEGQLDNLLSELRKEIAEQIKDNDKQQESLETVSAVEETLKSDTPSIKAAGMLLKTLPALGSISSIASAIMTFIS